MHVLAVAPLQLQHPYSSSFQVHDGALIIGGEGAELSLSGKWSGWVYCTSEHDIFAD